MTPARPIDRALALAAALAVAAAIAGCSSMPSLTGGGSPFGSSSTVDRTFIGAAQTWDFNKDGTVTCEEWKTYAVTLIKESDGNGDGALEGAEFEQMAKTDRLFTVADLAYYDANGDGKVTAEEMTGKQNAAFRILDKNSDCRIDRNETVQVLQVDKPKGGTAPNIDQQVPGAGR